MFNLAMDQVAIDLCTLIQGTAMAYVQSDEVSVLIHTYKRHTSQGWFGNKVQKVVSVSAAQAAVTMTMMSSRIFGKTRPALFDSRVFIVPENDVANYFRWRQQDAERNSTHALARYHFGHKNIHGKSVTTMRKMCRENGTPWEDCAAGSTSGRLVQQVHYQFEQPGPDGALAPVLRSKWKATDAREVDWQATARAHLVTED